jgi:hypothetical protein
MQKDPDSARSPGCLRTPSASPVSSDSSSVIPRLSIVSPSATSWSPGSILTTSPGTTSSASRLRIAPSRRTFAWGATSTASSSSVRLAFSSWRIPI